MNWSNLVVLLVITAILALAVLAIYKSGKKGKKCMGCPDSCACTGNNCAGGCNHCCK